MQIDGERERLKALQFHHALLNADIVLHPSLNSLKQQLNLHDIIIMK